MSTSINKPYPASMISSILNKLKRPNMSQTCHTWHVTWPRPVSECYQPALLGGKCHPVSVVTHSLVTWDWTHSGLDSDTHSCLRVASVVIYSWLLLSSRWIQQQECRQFIKAANDRDVSDGECLCLCWGVVGHSRGEVWPPRVLLAADVQPAAHPPPLPRLPGGGEGGGAALHGGQEALRSEAPDDGLQPLPSHVQRLDISRSGPDILLLWPCLCFRRRELLVWRWIQLAVSACGLLQQPRRHEGPLSRLVVLLVKVHRLFRLFILPATRQGKP